MHLASDEELIERARAAPGQEAEACLEELFARTRPIVALWCLGLCRDRELAADLAQEVLLRVHLRLGSFRLESAFKTWLYRVTRTVTFNHLKRHRKRQDRQVEDFVFESQTHPEASQLARVQNAELRSTVKKAVSSALQPREISVLYLHFVDGLTLPAITDLLGLQNKSGAKAYLVSAKRKLRRALGRSGLAPATPGVHPSEPT